MKGERTTSAWASSSSVAADGAVDCAEALRASRTAAAVARASRRLEAADARERGDDGVFMVLRELGVGVSTGARFTWLAFT